MKKITICLIMLLTLSAAAQDAAQPPAKPSILVAYFSEKGHTRAMAEAVAKGAESVEGVTVKLMSVTDAKPEDALAADAIIVGSPVYKASVAPKVQEFINSWPIKDNGLRNKLGAAFATGSGISAGEELTQMSILHSMLVCQMIVVGGPSAGQPFGASAVGENPTDKPDEKGKDELVSQYYLKKGEALGKRVAELAVAMKGAKEKQ